MTIGKRIKEYRNAALMTQDKLAFYCNVHPVSIRKYETDMMQPQPPQLEKIAAALDVSYNALLGISNNNLRFKTIGDLMGLLMTLCELNVLQINGERPNGEFLDNKTVKFQFNPVLAKYLKLTNQSCTEDPNGLSFDKLSFTIKNNYYLKFMVNWECSNYIYKNLIKENINNANETIEELESLLDFKESTEIRAQTIFDELDFS